MSFYASSSGAGFLAGYFLVDDEECLRETMTIAANHKQAVTLENGAKVVPSGAVIPSNDAKAKGILYEDIDVSFGDAPGSVVTKGVVEEGKLPAKINAEAKTAMVGITVIENADTVVRPY